MVSVVHKNLLRKSTNGYIINQANARLIKMIIAKSKKKSLIFYRPYSQEKKFLERQCRLSTTLPLKRFPV